MAGPSACTAGTAGSPDFTLLDLPSHIIMEVLHQLHDVFDLCACARTCRLLYQICCSAELWPHHRPAGPLVHTVQQLLSSALGHLPPPIFSVQLEPARSRKFPICVPLHNLRGVLGIVDATSLAEQAISTIQDWLSGLKPHQKMVLLQQTSLPPHLAAFQFCRADFGAVRFGLNPAVAAPLELTYISQLPKPPLACDTAPSSGISRFPAGKAVQQLEYYPRTVQVHSWTELQQQAAQELWRRVEYAGMQLAPKYQKTTQHQPVPALISSTRVMMDPAGPWSHIRSEVDAELQKQLAALHATGGSLIPSTQLEDMRQAVVHLLGLCGDHQEQADSSSRQAKPMFGQFKLGRCARVVVSLASFRALQQAVMQAVQQAVPPHTAGQDVPGQHGATASQPQVTEDDTYTPSSSAGPGRYAGGYPQQVLAAVSNAAHEECVIDCLTQLDGFVSALLAVRWHRTARPSQPPDIPASRRSNFNPALLTLNQLIFRSIVPSNGADATSQRKLDLSITPHIAAVASAAGLPVLDVSKAGKRAALQVMDQVEELMDCILKYLRRCRASKGSLLGIMPTAAELNSASLLECIVEVQRFMVSCAFPAVARGDVAQVDAVMGNSVQESALLNWCMVQACLSCAQWCMFVLGLDVLLVPTEL